MVAAAIQQNPAPEKSRSKNGPPQKPPASDSPQPACSNGSHAVNTPCPNAASSTEGSSSSLNSHELAIFQAFGSHNAKDAARLGRLQAAELRNTGQTLLFSDGWVSGLTERHTFFNHRCPLCNSKGLLVCKSIPFTSPPQYLFACGCPTPSCPNQPSHWSTDAQATVNSWKLTAILK